MNADGILTAYPNIGVTVTPAADFQITSFNFALVDDGDARGPLLKFFADIKNIGQALHCQFLPSVHLDGQEILTLVYGPPRHLKIGDTVFTTVDECIGPGDSAVMSGVQRGVTEADLKAATSLTIEPGPSNLDDDVYLAAVPPEIVGPEVAASAGGFLLQGTVSYAQTIHNQGIRVYPRDSRKLVVDEVLAFPGNLGSTRRAPPRRSRPKQRHAVSWTTICSKPGLKTDFFLFMTRKVHQTATLRLPS